MVVEQGNKPFVTIAFSRRTLVFILGALCIFCILATLEVSHHSSEQQQQRQWQPVYLRHSYEKTRPEKELGGITIFEAELVQNRVELSWTPQEPTASLPLLGSLSPPSHTESPSSPLLQPLPPKQESTLSSESPFPPPPNEAKTVSITARRPKIYDHVLCNDEMDMLEIRFRELDSVVARFFVFESNRTFSDKTKPLYFQENRDRFQQYEHKITHIVLPLIPEPEKIRIRQERLLWFGWEPEVFARNKALSTVFQDPEIQEGDWIILSDIDEIPRADVLRALIANTEMEQDEDEDKRGKEEEGPEPFTDAPWAVPKGKDILRLKCQYFQFSFEYQGDIMIDNGPVLLRYREQNSTRFNYTRDQRDIARGIKTEEEVKELYQAMDRNWINGGHYLRMARENKNLPRLHESCWHCSFCLPTVADVVRKLESYSHSEHNSVKYKNVDHLVAVAAQGQNIYNSDDSFKYIPENRDVPLKLREEYTDHRYDYLLRRHGKTHTGGFQDVPDPEAPTLVEDSALPPLSSTHSIGESEPVGTDRPIPTSAAS